MPTIATQARKRRAAPARSHRLKLTVQSNVASHDVPSREALRRIASAALECDANVTLRIVDGREGRALNRRYRHRDYATNVLTFVYDDGMSLAGDIVLCAPVVAREARAQRKTQKAHYAHLVIHGMLHLQGYDHERDDEAARMEAREIRLLRELGYDDPYAER
ncbi:MAG TPA: rRNA maturation RNase YbeY [Casimicrobiaceae bacterium]|nr:rRNA maturation RNase YbeY [Casimicrobiaceae bacterium]